MKTAAEMSVEEFKRYVEDFRATASALSSALAMFHFRAMNGATPAERTDAAKQAIITRRALDLLELQFAAVTRGNSGVNPPTQAQVDEAVARATELAKVDATSAKISTFVQVATDVASAFSQLHPAGPAMPASPVADAALAAMQTNVAVV